MTILEPWALLALASLPVASLPDAAWPARPQVRTEQVVRAGASEADGPGFTVRALDVEHQTVRIADPAGRERALSRHEKVGPWSLMAVVEDADELLAVFEDTEDRRGDVLFVSNGGVRLALGKSLERTSVPEDSLYGGHTREEILEGSRDVLGEEILALEGDPSYERVAPLLPPLRVPTFVGTNVSIDKPTFDYGAFSDEIYVDVGKVYPEIAEARARLDVWEGLVGGWLPIPRWVFPSGEDRYWDVTIFADEDGASLFTQPVWFRILLRRRGLLSGAARDPPGLEGAARADVHRGRPRRADRGLLPARAGHGDDHARGRPPEIRLPAPGGDRHLRRYGYSNVDTFQDVFNTSVNTFLEWGLLDIVRGYIDFYFSNYVRADGSIDTRGTETGQSGYMLAALAKYYRYTGDDELLRKHRTTIEGMIAVFDWMRAESRKVDRDDPSYGILRGWSEHDSSLRNDPYSLLLPFFGNSAGAIRGFTDLGRVFPEIGRRGGDEALEAEGARMVREAEAMKADLVGGERRAGHVALRALRDAGPAPDSHPHTLDARVR